MMFVHDIWVNWFEGEEHGYNVCHYHEWRKTDKIQLLERVPLLYISKDLYEEIENQMLELPKSLLDMIYQETFVRNGQKRTVINYACIVTSGEDMMAIDTADFRIPIRKSRLMPKHEQVILRMIETKKPEKFSVTKRKTNRKYQLFSLHPKWVYGLTRRERQLKRILMMALDQLRTVNQIEELRYWLTEWRPNDYPLIRFMSKKETWFALYEGIVKGWSPQHEEFGSKLVKGYPFLARMWEVEQHQGQDISTTK